MTVLLHVHGREGSKMISSGCHGVLHDKEVNGKRRDR